MLDLNQLTERCITYLESIENECDPSHRIDHVLRVVEAAKRLATAEGARLEVVLPAAFLHDAVPVAKSSPLRTQASRLSAKKANILLQGWDYPQELIPEIMHAVEAHSFSAGIIPLTLEAQVVQDADRLDSLGAMGIYRTIAVGTSLGRPLYSLVEPFPGHREADDRRFTLDHFYKKLLGLKNTMQTKAGRKEADRRTQTMQRFLEALADEIGVDFLPYAEASPISQQDIKENDKVIPSLLS